MANLRLCVKNAIDYASMSASPDMLPTLPPSNLQLIARGRVAQSTSAAVQQIKFHWNGAGYYMNFLMLSRHNLEGGSSWRVQLYSSRDWTGTPIYDSGTVEAVDGATLGESDFGSEPLGAGIQGSYLGQVFSIVYFARVRAVSGIVTLDNTTNAYGYLQASRLYAGDYTELAYNPQTADFAWGNETRQKRSGGGSLRSDGKIAYRTLDMSVDFLTDAQRSIFADQLRFAGQSKDIFLSLFPGVGGTKERDYSMIAKYVGQPPKMRMQSARFQTLAVQLSLQET